MVRPAKTVEETLPERSEDLYASPPCRVERQHPATEPRSCTERLGSSIREHRLRPPHERTPLPGTPVRGCGGVVEVVPIQRGARGGARTTISRGPPGGRALLFPRELVDQVGDLPQAQPASPIRTRRRTDHFLARIHREHLGQVGTREPLHGRERSLPADPAGWLGLGTER